MNYHKQRNNEKTGFTLIEIIVASAILSLFITGVFSFYRMGSRMFMSGSWKFEKQKSVERFLTILKERIEQASNATEINPASPNAVASGSCNFLTLDNGLELVGGAFALPTRAMLFSVCKPDMTLISPADPDMRGLILRHSLMAIPATKNLYTLNLHANTNAVAHDGIDYFNTPGQIGPVIPGPPATSTLSNFPAGFSNTPAFYGFGAVPQTFRLTDVASASIVWSQSEDGEKVVGIRLRLVNPADRNPAGNAYRNETSIEHGIDAKLDLAVPIVGHAVGGF